jgi:hypothetical protein
LSKGKGKTGKEDQSNLQEGQNELMFKNFLLPMYYTKNIQPTKPHKHTLAYR